MRVEIFFDSPGYVKESIETFFNKNPNIEIVNILQTQSRSRDDSVAPDVTISIFYKEKDE